MGYIPGYEFDIFISYAHVDNLTVSPQEKGWVEQFHQHLEVRLSKRIGRIGAVKIWRDPALDGSQLFDKTIFDKIKASALFLAITSQGYLASDYCRKELAAFHEKANNEPGGLVVGDRLRVFNNLINNINHTKWPEEFGRTSGFPFHDAESDDQFGEPSEPTSTRSKFHQQMRELVNSAYQVLISLKEQLSQPTAKTKETELAEDEDKFNIYLADVPDSLRSIQKRIKIDLKQKGINILKTIPPPYDVEPHDKSFISTVKKADLSIHLLDRYSGREMDDESEITYTQKQVKLGLKHARSQLIWIPKKLDLSLIEEENQKKLLDRLEKDPRKEAQYDFIRGTQTSITREILDKVEQLKKPPATEILASFGAVLLDTHIKDQLHAFELSRYLLEKKIQPFVNPQEDDPLKNLHFFEERLKQVGMLIIFYGDVDEEWVRERLGVAVQIAISHNYPLKAFGVYMAPPHKKSKQDAFNQGFLKVHLMDNSDRFHPESLKPLLSSISGRA